MARDYKRIDDCIEIECDSCHCEFIANELDDVICRGCEHVVCQSCTDVFGHCDDMGGKRGEHGMGDPSTRIATLESQLAERDAEVEELKAKGRHESGNYKE